MHLNPDLNLDVFFSLFDLIIFGLVVWGGWVGYSKGAIVQSISLFAMLGGLTIAVILTKYIYFFFISVKSPAPDLFASIVLGILFGGAIYGSTKIRKLVQNNVADAKKTIYVKLVGIALGMMKFFLIVSVFALVTYKLDIYGRFLPPSERKSKLGNLSASSLTKIFKFLKMDYHDTNPQQDTIYLDSLDFQRLKNLHKNVKDLKDNEDF